MLPSVFARPALVAPLTLLPLFAARNAGAEPSCPAPSVAQGTQCVLRVDAVLTDTIWLASGTRFNCQGHRLTPVTSGTLDDPRTAENEFQPSRPELALFVHRAYDVKIQNCDISGFDFGIIVAQSKTANVPVGSGPTRTKIVANTIHVRTNPIDIIKSDGVIISDNHLTYDAERGRGVVVDYDSDGNEISGNTIVSTDAASTGQTRQLPGGPLVTSTAIMDNEIHLLQSDKPLQNFVVSGVLVQVPSHDPQTDMEDSARTDHNVIEANDIVDLGVGPSCTLDPATSCRLNADCAGKGSCLLKQNSGIGFNLRAADTIVRGNRLSGVMDRGVSFAGVPAVGTLAGWFPGTCALDASRMCSTTADCSIPGYDDVSIGPCNGAAPITFNGNSLRMVAENNELSGTFDSGGLFANNTDQFTFRGNTIDADTVAVRLDASALSGLIERNEVARSTTALYLGFPPTFTHTIRLNDFTTYSVAIGTSNDFTTPADISADTGNYWGLPCPGFDQSRVRFDNGSVNPSVVDMNPYGVTVANTPDSRLPARCQ